MFIRRQSQLSGYRKTGKGYAKRIEAKDPCHGCCNGSYIQEKYDEKADDLPFCPPVTGISIVCGSHGIPA
ncbi:hypothetical protein GCM10009413_23740 [Tatumella punctata]